MSHFGASLQRRIDVGLGVFVLILLWTIVIPAAVAYRDRAFYSRDLEARLSSAPRRLINEFHERKRLYEQIIRSVDAGIATRITSGGALSEIAALQATRQSYEAVVSKLTPPIAVVGFEENTTPYLFAVAYLFLTSLLSSMVVEFSDRSHYWRAVAFGTAGYILYEWPTWVRNLLPDSEARKTFAFVNFDMSAGSFYLQELRVLLMFLIMGLICQKALHNESKISRAVRDWSGIAGGRPELINRAAVVNQLFSRWQWQSLILAAAFLPWTYLFWYELDTLSDTRYLVSGMLMHMAWLGLWYVLSLPLLTALKAWSAYRNDVLAASAAGGQDVEKLLMLLKDVDPPSTIQLMGVSAAAAISFVLPIFNLMHSR